MAKKQIKVYRFHTEGKKFIRNQTVQDLKVTTHEEYNEHGKLQSNQYVEFTVVGNNRAWPDFMDLRNFRKLNPDISI